MIEFKNVTKSYGDHKVLRDVSFVIKKGERVALIGASGAGKSTLLNLLVNTLTQDSGRILIEDQALDTYVDRKILASKIGIIRQQFDLVLPLKVINNVLVGRLRHWGFFKSLLSMFFHFDKDIAIEALKQVGIEDKSYEKTAHLSGGEQQRVAMARLLVQAPDVMLADEPIASLDPSRSKAVIDLLLDLSKNHGHTLLVSLHSIEIALGAFERVIALEAGQIVFDGNPSEMTKGQLERIYALKETKDIA